MGEVATVNRGVRVTRDILNKEGKIPVYQNSLTPLGYFDKSNRKKDTTFVISAGAAGQIGYSEIDFWAADDCFTFDDLNGVCSKYIYYYLQTKQLYIDSNVRKSSIPRISRGVFNKLQLPVPPLAVQSEIVRVLDCFTLLTAELTARKKQYEYYRDALLTPPFGIALGATAEPVEAQPTHVEWKTLGEIATDIYRGNGITRDQITEDGISCVRYGEIYTTYGIHFDKCVSHTKLENISNPKYFEHGDILFAITGEKIEDIAKSTAYVGNEKCLAGGDIVVMKHNQNPKYLSYALSTTNAIKQKGAGKVKSKVVHSSVPAISAIKIPIPPLSVQERIVNVLDNFDVICSDLKIGLPAEIDARKKQYEYYRDLLLTFAERGNTIFTEQNRTEQNRTEQNRTEQMK